jgi:hypothetical protein
MIGSVTAASSGDAPAAEDVRAVTARHPGSDAVQALQTRGRGITANRKSIQGPGITGFSGTFQASQYAFVVRQQHFFEVWTTHITGDPASAEKLALLAAARDHALND